MRHANTRFEIQSWDEAPCEQVSSLLRATVQGRYTGDLVGTGVWEMVMSYLPDGSASCTWMEHVAGRLGDDEGSFLMRHTGVFSDGAITVTSEIVSGSGTDGLTGLHGHGGYTAPRGSVISDFTLEYGFTG